MLELPLLGKDTESPPRRIPVNGKTPTVKRQNVPDAERLPHGDQRGIRIIHWDIGIFRHQVNTTIENRGVHRNQFGSTRKDEIERRLLSGERRAEQMYRLGQHRLGRNQPPPEIPEKRGAPLMIPLAPVEQGNKRAGVQQQISHAGTGCADVRGGPPRGRECRFPPFR